MLNKICTVYDSKAESYMRPFVAKSTGEAVRSFQDEVNSNRADSIVSSHAEDFTLFEIGTWDEVNGAIEMYEAKKSLANGIDLKQKLNS